MQDIDVLIEKYLKELSKSYKDFDKNIDIIKKACDVAKLAHEGQFRKYSGSPYIAHPLRVAVMASEKSNNLPLILAAILHDTVEDSPEKVSMKFIYKEFGEEVGYLVDSVTANILFYYKTPKIKLNDKLDKLLTGMMVDARCGVLKLLDREHNNKTLEGLKTDKQIRKSFETQALYNPLRVLLRMDESDFILEETCGLLKLYLKNNKINTVEELKSNLYNIAFKDIDSNNFDLFYYSSDSIIWEIENKKVFENLVKNPSFDEKIEIISLKQDIDANFSCLFKYKEGKVFEGDFQVKVSRFKY